MSLRPGFPLHRLLCLLALCLLLPAWLTAGGDRVRIAFSMASFPDIAIQDTRAALEIWSEEVTRNFQGFGEITTVLYPTPGLMAAGLRKGEVDLAILPTVDYFRLEPTLKVDLGFLSDMGPGGADRYVLLVPQKLQGQGLAALRGARLCYVAKDDMGLLFLNHALLSSGLPEMDQFFASTLPSSKGAKALNSVYFGQAEACLVTEEAYRLMTAMNPQVAQRMRPMVYSPRLHAGLAVYRHGYPQHMRQRIMAAVNSLKNYPRGAQIMSLFKSETVRPATEEALAEARRIYLDYRKRLL